MNQVKLESIIQFAVGKNATRIKDTEEKIYLADDFEKDLHSINETEKSSECIINLIKSKAAPLSEKNKGKCITSNFIKCSFDTNILDPWYLCYQFNEGQSFEQQISMFHQGITLSVKRLSIKSVGELVITLPPIGKQRLIGKMYKRSILQNDLMLKQAENYKTFMLETIHLLEEE